MSDYGALPRSDWQPDVSKDPNDTVDLVFNWHQELNGDTISTSDFLFPDGLVEVSASDTDATATVFVSGGTEGQMYRVTCRIVTVGGRTLDKTKYVLVREH